MHESNCDIIDICNELCIEIIYKINLISGSHNNIISNPNFCEINEIMELYVNNRNKKCDLFYIKLDLK